MPRRVTLAERVYRSLPFCFPAEFRYEYGPEMVRLFRDRYRERHGRIRLWLQTLADIAIKAPQEHIDMLWNDLRHTFRVLRNSSGFAVTAVLSLALAIGANTAIFTVVDAVLLRPLPVKAPEALVALERVSPQARKSDFSYPLYEDLRDRCDAFSGVIARESNSFVMSAGAERERVGGEFVSENYFSVLGVGAHLGRVFGAEDARAGASAAMRP
jgi:putative ABC transport system permease protein